MAPLPKRRHSTRRGGKRQAAIRLIVMASTVCPNCSAQIKSHQICASCGFYNGKQRKQIKTKPSKRA